MRIARRGGCGDRPGDQKGSGEQSLARTLYPRLEEDWLLIADRNFYNWPDWCAAADTGAALLWRVKSDLRLPVLEFFPDGSYRSVLVSPKVTGKAREQLLEAARAGGTGPGARPARPRHRVRGPRPRRRRERRADRPGHHHHRVTAAPAAVLAPPITSAGCDTKSLGASGTRRRRTGLCR